MPYRRTRWDGGETRSEPRVEDARKTAGGAGLRGAVRHQGLFDLVIQEGFYEAWEPFEAKFGIHP